MNILLIICLILTFIDIGQYSSSIIILLQLLMIVFVLLNRFNISKNSLVFGLIFFSVIILNFLKILNLQGLLLSLIGVMFYGSILFYFETHCNAFFRRVYVYVGLFFVYSFGVVCVLYALRSVFVQFSVGGFAYNLGGVVAPFLRPFNYSNMAFTETDAIQYIIMLSTLTVLNSRGLTQRLFYFIIWFCISLLLSKSILVLAVIYLFIFSFFPDRTCISLFKLTNILCWLFPFLLIWMHYNFYLNDEILDIISNGRILIWKSALDEFLIISDKFDVWRFLFGGSRLYIDYMMPLSGYYENVSYHSAYLRLFLMYGFILYLAFFLIFSTIWINFLSRQYVNTKRVMAGYLSAILVVCLTDSSIGYNFDYYLQFFFHLLIIKFYTDFRNFDRNKKVLP
jgi:hypothetical protein